jgi:hypothetical protein
MNPYGVKLDTRRETIKFDLKSKTWRDFINKLKENHKHDFTISTHYGKRNYAHDSGATRNFFVKMWDQMMIDLGSVDNFYFNIDPLNDFWIDTLNLRAFVHMIALTLKSEATMTRHFHPVFWKIFSGADAYDNDIVELYVKHVDPFIYNQVCKLTDKEFSETDSAYNSKQELFESILCKNLTDADYALFYNISEYVPIYFDFGHVTSNLDIAFSGQYVLDPDIIVDLFEYEKFNQDKIALWKKLVKSLNQTELRNMLLLFGSSLRTFSVKYTLICESIDSDHIEHHLKIFVCSRRIKINERLLENYKTLSAVKLYFADSQSEIISDSQAAIHSQIESDSDEEEFIEPNFQESSDEQDFVLSDDEITDSEEDFVEPNISESSDEDNDSNVISDIDSDASFNDSDSD